MCQGVRAKVGRGASGKCWVEGKVDVVFIFLFFSFYPLSCILLLFWRFSFCLTLDVSMVYDCV